MLSRPTCKAAVATLFLVACQTELASSDFNEVWNPANNPAFIDPSFEYRVDRLPTTGTGASHPVWAWRSSKGGINYRWEDDAKVCPGGEENSVADACPNDLAGLSPIEKYEQAFGRAGLVEEYKRIKFDTSNQIPAYSTVHSGWAPYAISEPSALSSVVRNGVEFHPRDLDGLMSLVYSNITISKSLGEACEGLPTSQRGATSQCRDINPGAFHVLLTNTLGLAGKAILVDQNPGAAEDLWPMISYSASIREISGEKAMEAYSLAPDKYDVLDKEEIGMFGTRSGAFTSRGRGTATVELVTLEPSKSGLYINKGKPASASQHDTCYEVPRPFSASFDNPQYYLCQFEVEDGETVYWTVANRGFSKVQANLTVKLPRPETTSYAYNPSAERFFSVWLEAELLPAYQLDDLEPQAFPFSRSYAYILETDSAGRIVGGEWLGYSHYEHPDLAVWGFDPPFDAMNGQVRYSEIKELYDASSGH